MYTRGEVSLWRDLIEFWVYGVWFAKLLIKHPRRRPRHTATQITHQLCLTNCRVTSSSPSPFRLHLSSSWIVTRKSLSLSLLPSFLRSRFRWLIFKLEFNPPMLPPPPQPPSSMFHGVVSELLLPVLSMFCVVGVRVVPGDFSTPGEEALIRYRTNGAYLDLNPTARHPIPSRTIPTELIPYSSFPSLHREWHRNADSWNRVKSMERYTRIILTRRRGCLSRGWTESFVFDVISVWEFTISIFNRIMDRCSIGKLLYSLLLLVRK